MNVLTKIGMIAHRMLIVQMYQENTIAHVFRVIWISQKTHLNLGGSVLVCVNDFDMK